MNEYNTIILFYTAYFNRRNAIITNRSQTFADYYDKSGIKTGSSKAVKYWQHSGKIWSPGRDGFTALPGRRTHGAALRKILKFIQI